jgi:hypothetical protein
MVPLSPASEIATAHQEPTQCHPRPLHQPAIARLEAGDHEPSLATLSRLARVLGIELHIDITPDTFGLRETA